MKTEAYLCIAKRHSNVRRRRKNLDGIRVISPSGKCVTVLMKRVRQEDWSIYLYIDNIISLQDKAGTHPIKNVFAKVYLTYEEMNMFLYLYNNQTCHTRYNEITQRNFINIKHANNQKTIL